MNCIIIDDEPLAREAIEILVKDTSQLNLLGMFNNALAASKFMEENPVDLIFLDIQMPGITGIEFARNISKRSLVIFTTAYSEYAVDSYEVDAIDYLIKPIDPERFHKAVNKAIAYHSLLLKEEKENIEAGNTEYFFVKSERRYFKINYKDILFIEGLKDYVIIQLDEQRVITRMNLKNIFELLINAIDRGLKISAIDTNVKLKKICELLNNECENTTAVLSQCDNDFSLLYQKQLEKVMYKEYALNGETIHRGYYCPSPIRDIVISNCNRGRLLKGSIKSSKVVREY